MRHILNVPHQFSAEQITLVRPHCTSYGSQQGGQSSSVSTQGVYAYRFVASFRRFIRHRNQVISKIMNIIGHRSNRGSGIKNNRGIELRTAGSEDDGHKGLEYAIVRRYFFPG